MPSTLQTPKGTRCIRCATLIRNSRTNCPSCDLDFTASNSKPSPNGNSKSNSKVISRVGSRVGTAINPAADSSARNKNRAARAGMKLCPVCMSSVAESEMSESSGQMVCNACAVKLKNKPARAPGAPGVVASNSAPPQMVSKSEPEARPVSHNGPPAKPIMSDDELLTAKGMQRQLMDKLLWIKVFVLIWGFLIIIIGGFVYMGGAMGSALTNSFDENALNHAMKDSDFTDDDGNQLSAAKIAEERERIRDGAVKARDAINAELFKLKLGAGFSIFIGVSFITAFFLMKHKPYETCVIITILYVCAEIMNALFIGLDHVSIIDIFLIICVLSTLVTGIRTGMRIKDIRERAEAATGRPVIG